MFEGLLAAMLLYCCNYVRQINKVMNDDDDNHDEPDLSSQTIEDDIPDLTKFLRLGDSSAKLSERSHKYWRAYIAIDYEGANIILHAGRSYPTTESMGILSPIKSIRRV